jgi:hypothetical protein
MFMHTRFGKQRSGIMCAGEPVHVNLSTNARGNFFLFTGYCLL